MMLADQNTYGAYTENTFVGASPLQLVIALYEGAVEAIKAAQYCFESGDVMGRGVAVTKTVKILSELMYSLDMEKGGEISVNLKQLYSYMQSRVLLAHTSKQVQFLTEVEGLLMNLLEGWKVAANQPVLDAAPEVSSSLQEEDYGELILESESKEEEVTYTGYFLETGVSVLGQAYSF